jgi:ATP-dependent Clp protease ATP-binding subunit ClpB
VSREEIMRTLQANFKPEFLNRVDEIIIFHSLLKEQLGKIVSIQLKRVEKLLSERGFTLEITPSAREYLAEVGYDADFGARPLKRAIQRELQDPLAMKLLNGDFTPGQTIVADGGTDELTFKVK